MGKPCSKLWEIECWWEPVRPLPKHLLCLPEQHMLLEQYSLITILCSGKHTAVHQINCQLNTELVLFYLLSPKLGEIFEGWIQLLQGLVSWKACSNTKIDDNVNVPLSTSLLLLKNTRYFFVHHVTLQKP